MRVHMRGGCGSPACILERLLRADTGMQGGLQAPKANASAMQWRCSPSYYEALARAVQPARS